MRPDILVRDRDGEAVLAVEVKARRGVSRDWAAHLRRNLNAHGASVTPTYFMVVTIDEAFLWRDGAAVDHDELRAPDASAPTSKLLGHHLVATNVLDGRTLELVVSAWLNAVATQDVDVERDPAIHDFLIDSGLRDALRGDDHVIAFEPA